MLPILKHQRQNTQRMMATQTQQRHVSWATPLVQRISTGLSHPAQYSSTTPPGSPINQSRRVLNNLSLSLQRRFSSHHDRRDNIDSTPQQHPQHRQDSAVEHLEHLLHPQHRKPQNQDVHDKTEYKIAFEKYGRSIPVEGERYHEAQGETFKYDACIDGPKDQWIVLCKLISSLKMESSTLNFRARNLCKDELLVMLIIGWDLEEPYTVPRIADLSNRLRTMFSGVTKMRFVLFAPTEDVLNGNPVSEELRFLFGTLTAMNITVSFDGAITEKEEAFVSYHYGLEQGRGYDVTEVHLNSLAAGYWIPKFPIDRDEAQTQAINIKFSRFEDSEERAWLPTKKGFAWPR